MGEWGGEGRGACTKNIASNFVPTIYINMLHNRVNNQICRQRRHRRDIKTGLVG